MDRKFEPIRIVEYERSCKDCAYGFMGYCDRKHLDISETGGVCDMHTMCPALTQSFRMEYDMENPDFRSDESRLNIDTSKSKLVLTNGQELDLSKLEGSTWHSERILFALMRDSVHDGMHDLYKRIICEMNESTVFSSKRVKEIYDELVDKNNGEYSDIIERCPL